MKPWDDLTEAGKIRRLRPLAMEALAAYDITPLRLRLVGGFTNVIFRVDTPDGPLALRIDYMLDHDDNAATVELAWLMALEADTDIDVCRVVPTRDGRPWVDAATDGVPGARRCVLFEWVPGRSLNEHLDVFWYRRLGILEARLHEHAATWTPPLAPMSWDRVFYWPEDVDPVVIDEPEHAAIITPSRRQLLADVIARLEPEFAALDPGDARVIHTDLHPWNLHVHRSRLIAFDFEDVSWGHPVQDIAVSMSYIRDRPHHAALEAAFEDGYRSVTDWPLVHDGQIESFIAARTVMFVNFLLNLGDDPDDFFLRAFTELRSYLEQHG